MGDRIWSAASRRHRKGAQHDDVAEPRRNAAGTYTFAAKVTACGGGVSQVPYKVVIQATANHVVDLNWTGSTSANVVGYNVYRSPDAATWKKMNVSLIASTLYSDSTVANSSTYYYAATAVDVNGNESAKTAAVKAVVP